MTATISKIFLSCFPKCATKSSSNKKILNKRKSSHNVTLESSSEQPDQVIKSNYKIEQTILPVIPTVVFNDEIESNLLSTNEDRRKSRILLLNANKNSISDDSQSPKCLKCNGDLSSWDYVNDVLCNFWCNFCESQELQRNFSNWTSGNLDIDNLIQESQLNIGYNMSYLEWIPSDRLTDMIEIGKGGFATVYSAIWIDGPRDIWNDEKKIWERGGERTVAVKRLHNSANINPEFLNELKLHSHRFRDSYILQYFGISRHSITGDFMLVMEFTNKGNLRNYLQSVPNMSWAQKIDILESLIIGLSQLHNDAILPHKDFHPGNILISNLGFPDDEPIIVTSVSDFGLTKPASIQTESSSVVSELYGVMPYVAPEVLQGHPFTKAADIYSLAMVMWELSSGKPPFYNRAHDHDLVLDIYNGVRPEIIPGTPKCYVELMKSCWNTNEFERPTVQMVAHTLFSWTKELYNTKSGEFYQQFKEADENRHKESTLISIHPQAIYTSRPLKQFTRYTTISYVESLESSSFYEHSRHNSTGPLIQYDDI
ncbi:kinase-like domain-containing protein [Gigaspora rosea]|uniref:Kinase-like domain-containing protein n=1 Tax=Gigaspora rosea TaxID=44941 RepID=A0A397V3A4_9GLOM|nr:kinase-like domain-containing protein [Gigaspora rosea]